MLEWAYNPDWTPTNSIIFSPTVCELWYFHGTYGWGWYDQYASQIAIHCDGDQDNWFGTGICSDRDLGGPSPQQCPLLTPNPIHTATGNKYHRETDYQGEGPLPLRLVRHYNSRDPAVTAGVLGYKWRTIFSRSIEEKTYNGYTTAHVHRPDGKRLGFLWNGTTWQSEPDIVARLERLTDGGGVPTGWRHTGADDTVELYDVNGRLVSISNRDGLTQGLAYDLAAGSGGDGDPATLDQVTGPFGRTLNFAYDASARITSLTDPAGGLTRYSYDANGNLATVSYPDATPLDDSDNPTRSYLYEDPDFVSALTGILDENGDRFATYAYDSQGRATLSEHAGGAERVGLVYNADGTTTVTDASGRARTYHFVTEYGRTKLDHIDGGPCDTCNGAAQAYGYDANGFIASKTDHNGNLTTYVNNARGLQTSRTEAAGSPEERTVSTDWHPDFRLPTRITEADRVTDYVYDSAGRLLTRTETDPATGVSRSWTYGYTAEGVLASVDGSRTDLADVTSYGYDPEGNRISTTNALGHVTQITAHDAHGRPLTVQDPNGTVTQLGYDARGRLTSRTVAGATTSMTYDAAGNLTRTTLADGSYLDYGYDAAHRPTSVTDNLGNRITYTLDAQGNRTREDVTDPQATLTRTLSRVYDDLNRLVESIGAQNQITRYGYDANGNRTEVIDPLNQVTGHAFDALNRLIQSTDPLTGITSYDYDAQDNLVAVTDPRGLTTSYQYDGLGNRIEQSSPDNGITTYTHDPVGNVLTQTDARGITVSYSYDALNRVTAVQYPDPTQDVSYTYDQGTNGIGRLTGIDGPHAGITYQYDARGNRVAETHILGTHSYTFSYAYDAADRLIQIGYPSGRTVDYWRDAAGRIEAVTTTADGLTEPLASDITYQPFGPRSGLTYGNGLSETRGYDLDGRLTALDVGSLWNRAYPQIDANGNIRQILDDGLTDDYAYDPLDRLAQASGGFGSRDYGYDEVGNRTSLTKDGQLIDYGYALDSNRLESETGWSYSRDAIGNRTERLAANGSGRLYSYDESNRLTGVSQRTVTPGKGNQPPTVVDTPIAEYAHNPLGQRIGKTTGGVITHYLYGPDGSLLVEAIDGQVRREYVTLDGEPLAMLDAREVFPPAEEVILDEGDAGTSAAGSWQPNTSNKAYGGDYLLADGATGSSYRWTPNLGGGTYQVYARWVAKAQNASAVPYTLHHQGVSDSVSVDQSKTGGQWVLLGTYAFSGDGSEYVEVSDANGQAVADAVRFLQVNVPPQTVTDTRYLHTDHLGTPRAATCAAGNVVWRWASDPFGTSYPDENPDGDGESVQIHLRFPGQYYDAETGLHYNYFRDYDPGIGRYVESDPIGLEGGLNTYAYVGGNPNRYTDPSGLLLGLPAIPAVDAAINTIGGLAVLNAYLNPFRPDPKSVMDGFDPSTLPDAANDPNFDGPEVRCHNPDDPCKKRYLDLKHLWLGIRDAVERGLVTRAAARELAEAYNREREEFIRKCPSWGEPPKMNPFNPNYGG